MLSKEQKIEFSEILEELGRTLDISPSQYDTIVKSYQAVGDWLSKEDSLLFPYSPKITPQGSLILGTTIKPIHEEDDIDVDLVCELQGKRSYWTQADVKKIVGDRLKFHGTYKEMITKEGRRCWTLGYSETANYHMDVLPSITGMGYSALLERMFSEPNISDTDSSKLVISITDNTLSNYNTETESGNWLKSNPFGYARWFFYTAQLQNVRLYTLNEAIKPLPKYQPNKLPLQRVIQILKRHRDMMFNGDDAKPISIIITTLAAKAYQKQPQVLDALVGVIERIETFIEERYDYQTEKYIKWVGNPVNPTENFADKWVDHPEREKNFFKWLNQVKTDIAHSTSQTGKHRIQESLYRPFGQDIVLKTFSNIGENARKLTQQGQNAFDPKLGITALGTSYIKPHTFHGNTK